MQHIMNVIHRIPRGSGSSVPHYLVRWHGAHAPPKEADIKRALSRHLRGSHRHCHGRVDRLLRATARVQPRLSCPCFFKGNCDRSQRTTGRKWPGTLNGRRLLVHARISGCQRNVNLVVPQHERQGSPSDNAEQHTGDYVPLCQAASCCRRLVRRLFLGLRPLEVPLVKEADHQRCERRRVRA